MRVDLVYVTENPELLIAKAGRTCYKSVGENDVGGFIRRRVAEGHHSILEHASATFEISGISRACSHQLVRHRIASYSQESQRYVDMSDPTFIIPPGLSQEALEGFRSYLDLAVQGYSEMVRLGVPKEDARFLLPNATATRIIVTMNFRELRHFFKVRMSKGAQWEIKALAGNMLQKMVVIAPNVFYDLVQRCEEAG